MVPADLRWGKEMELPMRIKTLTQTTSIVIFRYIAQASAPTLSVAYVSHDGPLL